MQSHTATAKITTQGDTSSPTRVKIQVTLNDEGKLKPAQTAPVRVRVVDDNGYANADYATIAASNGSVVLETFTSSKDLVISPPVAVAATGTLNISGVAKHGETATIGSRVYEFVASASYLTSNVVVDISGGTTAAQGTLSLGTQPTVGDTMTIGSRTYAFVALGTGNNDGEIALGANVAATQPLVVAAINGTDGWNTANATVTAAAFSGSASVLTAKVEGTVGNSIVTTETFQAGGNVFDAATLGTTTAGADCAAAAAVTALVSAIIADTNAVVSAVDGAGNTVVVTQKITGEAGNDTATTETMSNGAWGAATLTGGVDAENAAVYVDITNATTAPVDILVGTAPLGPTIAIPTRLTVRHAAD
jgi:hypothetical protein